MTYKIIFSDKAEKQVAKLSKDIQKRIFSTLNRLRIRPESHLTKLIGDPCYKFRIGDYRVIVDLEKDNLLILVIKVGHRRNIYNL